jgi:hypothetical protein
MKSRSVQMDDVRRADHPRYAGDEQFPQRAAMRGQIDVYDVRTPAKRRATHARDHG